MRAGICLRLRWLHAPQRYRAGPLVVKTACAAHSTAADPQQSPLQEASASRPPRFYVPLALQDAPAGSLLRLPSDEARHATKTLRLREGDRLELCDGRGYTVLAEITAVDRSGAMVGTVQPPLQVPRAGWQWEVACACGSLKGGRSDWLVEKCAELGAAEFTPLLTERSPTIGSGGGDEGRAHSSKRAGRRRGTHRSAGGGAEAGGGEDDDDDVAGGGGSGREGRWARVATAAMKQCLRPHAMALSAPCSVRQLCLRVQAADTALVAVAGAPPLAAVAAQLPAGSHEHRHGILCIGPEGDWTAAELAALVEAGARPVGLGDLRLRAETAAVALLAYVRMQCQDEPA